MTWLALILENYFTSKSSTHRANVVLRVWCRHRPVERGIGVYPCGANDLTSWLKASTPASLRPYIPFQISRYTSPSSEMTNSYSSLISCAIVDGWIRIHLVVRHVGAEVKIGDVYAEVVC